MAQVKSHLDQIEPLDQQYMKIVLGKKEGEEGEEEEDEEQEGSEDEQMEEEGEGEEGE